MRCSLRPHSCCGQWQRTFQLRYRYRVTEAVDEGFSTVIRVHVFHAAYTLSRRPCHSVLVGRYPRTLTGGRFLLVLLTPDLIWEKILLTWK